MSGHDEIMELAEKIIAEQDRHKLIPLIEQFTKVVVEETKRLDAQIFQPE